MSTPSDPQNPYGEQPHNPYGEQPHAPQAPQYGEPQAPQHGAPQGAEQGTPGYPAAPPYPEAPQYGAASPYPAAPQYGSAPYPAAPQYGSAPYPGAPQYGVRGPWASTAKNSLGVWALVLGILGLVMCGFFAGIPAVIVGNKGKRAADLGEANNRGMANAGVILGWIGIGLSVVGVLFAIVVPVIVNSSNS